MPRTIDALTAVGRGGGNNASVVVRNVFDTDEGIIVDTHVARLTHRLGLTVQKHAESIEQDLMRLVPRDDWTLFSHLLIWHGRRRCYARGPDCEHCEVLSLCPRVGVTKQTPHNKSTKNL